jgi:hypothetical protein
MAAAAEAGLKPEKKSYAISFSLPLVVCFRIASKVLGRNRIPRLRMCQCPERLTSFLSLS